MYAFRAKARVEGGANGCEARQSPDSAARV